MKTHLPKVAEIQKSAKWFVIDAADVILGKVATEAARRLAGKHRVDFTPHLDLGDGVVVINAAKVHLTGQKLRDKLYRSHSGYRGNLKEIPAGVMLEKRPVRVIELAVAGMLPKNKLKDTRLSRLKVYAGAEHEQTAQKPEPITV
jgi:large subunit ribosomal protein L13